MKQKKSYTSKGFYHPGDTAYSGYLGQYHFYSFQTNADDRCLLHGVLNITLPAEQDSLKCSASLELETGEIIYLSFHHWHLLTNALACTTAMCITTSSGAKRRPTAVRVFLCRDELSREDQDIIKGQLRLNKAEIIISEKKLDEYIGNCYIPDDFMNNFISGAHMEKYYRVEESVLLEGHKKDIDFIKALSLLRNYSISPKNNKISSNTDEYAYILYKNRKKVLTVRKIRKVITECHKIRETQ